MTPKYPRLRGFAIFTESIKFIEGAFFLDLLT
jgi:hypothetical protein